jgi:hypothetical protein
MENKRGTKRDRSPSIEGSPLLGDIETPPPAPSGSPPPLGSPSVASSHGPCSLVFEQGNASGNIPMLEPSSLVADTSRDGKIIILNDSDDDGEAQEGTTVEIESTVAPASVDDAPAEARIDNSDDQGPNKDADGRDPSRHSAGNP